MGKTVHENGSGREGGRDPNRESEEIFQEFLRRTRSGESVDPEEYLRQYPEMEEELKRLFDQMKGEAVPEGEFPVAPGGEEEKGEVPRVLGDFRIIREIGSGGMATVYEAAQISLSRRVALKVLPSHLSISGRAVQKFQREAEAGGRQCHPGIVAIYAVGEHEGVHYIAEELVEGGYSLDDRLEDLRGKGEVPIGYFREAAKLIAKVSDALQNAHDSGVIHRDVKPSNILLTTKGQPKVTDFGLAKVEDALALSRTGDFAGTPYYMSPEQAMSRRIGIDHRTDVYSLGVTLYEMLTLIRPFEGETTQDILKKIILQDPKDPHRVNPRVPRDLGVICLKAMEKDPNHRYQTMTEFGDDLCRFLHGEMIHAKPIGRVVRFWKRIKRNPVLSVTAGIALVAIVALLLLVPWYMALLAKSRNRAEKEANRAMKEANKRKEINTFLEGMLSSPNPEKKGHLVTVAEVLDEAVRELQWSSLEKEIVASLYDTIGNTYRSLGIYDKAKEQHNTAIEIFRKMGEENPENLGDRLTAENNLGRVFHAEGLLAEAERQFRKVLEERTRSLGLEDRGTLKSMDHLACVVGDLGRHGEAEAMHRRVLKLRIKTLGENDADTLASMNNLACVLADQKKYPEAEDQLKKVLEIQRRLLKENHPNILTTKSNLAIVLGDQGNHEKEAFYHRQVLEARRRVLPRNHPDTLASMDNLAWVLGEHLDEYDEALELSREALESWRMKRGKRHRDMLISMNNQAMLLLKKDRLDEAEPLFREVFEIAPEVLSQDHIVYSEAKASLEKALERFQKAAKCEEEQRIRALCSALHEACEKSPKARESSEKLPE